MCKWEVFHWGSRQFMMYVTKSTYCTYASCTSFSFMNQPLSVLSSLSQIALLVFNYIYIDTAIFTYLLTYLLTHSLTHPITPCRTVLLEKLTGFQLVKFSAFCEPEGSLRHSQVPTTCPCPEHRHNCKTPIMLREWLCISAHFGICISQRRAWCRGNV
jgi:hypothetical protein